jgi:hypothetical protein
MQNVRTRFTDVASHLLQDSNMVVRVEQCVLLGAIGASTRHLVRLEACLSQHDDQSLGIVVVGRDGHRLFSSERGKRRERLSARALSDRLSCSHCDIEAKGSEFE